MARLRDDVYRPDPETRAVYDALFAEYRRLHDDFGRGGNDAMKTLRSIRARVREGEPEAVSL
jgi:L-ribulokinase